MTRFNLTRQTSQNPKIGRVHYELDASGQILGHLAVKAANLLRGKDKIDFVAHRDSGDFVKICNIDQVAVSGNKLLDKKYYRHSGYLGSLKTKSLGDLLETKPEFVIRKAIERMLPANRLRDRWLKRLTLVKSTNK